MGKFFFENSFENMSLDRGVICEYDALNVRKSIDKSMETINLNNDTI